MGPGVPVLACALLACRRTNLFAAAQQLLAAAANLCCAAVCAKLVCHKSPSNQLQPPVACEVPCIQVCCSLEH
jgi:hypothetical protein